MHIKLTLLAVASAAVIAVPGSSASVSHLSADLASGEVSGHVVLGRTIAGVTASFGKPSWRVPGARTYRIGYGDRKNFTMMVIFRKRGGALRAVTVAFERQPLFEPELRMNVLAMPPRAFARAVRQAYPNALTIDRGPRCVGGICKVEFRSADSERRVAFGQTRTLGSYLTIWVP